MRIPAQLASQSTSFENISISIEDVSWQLSRMARYNGAFWYNEYRQVQIATNSMPIGTARNKMANVLNTINNSVYTVAQHSVYIYKYLKEKGASKEALKYALLHDAHECIIGDWTKPVQVELDVNYGFRTPDFTDEVEERTLEVFGCKPTKEDKEIVMNCDFRIVVDEFVGAGWLYPGNAPHPLGVNIEQWCVAKAKNQYDECLIHEGLMLC